MKSLRKKNSPLDDMYSKITENADLMDDLQKNLEKQQQQFFATSLHSKVIGESLKKYSDTTSTYNTRIPLSDCMQRASEWQAIIGDVFNHLGNVLYDRTTQPLKETIRIQLEMAKEGKKKVKKIGGEASGDFKASLSSSSLTNRANEFKKEQDNFEKVSKETLQLFNDSEFALENSAVQTILSAYEAYYDFFQKGAFQMARIKTDIDNYRKIILETNKVAAKLRNYIPRKTFGIKLEEIFAREAHRPIPMFLEEIFKYLEKVSPTVEGIFRVSAGKSAIDALQQKIETNQPLDLQTIPDPHAVSGVLKSFFRSLPEPLIYHSNYQKYLSLSSQEQNKHIPELKRLISSLPVSNQVVLKNVLAICSLVKQHKDVTKMDANNLAVVIGPNIMESIPGLKAEDIQKAETFAEFNSLFILLVENYQFIFPSQSGVDFARNRAQTESSILSNVTASPSKPLPEPPTTIISPSSKLPAPQPNELSLSSISISDPNDHPQQHETKSCLDTVEEDSNCSNNSESETKELPPPPLHVDPLPQQPSSPLSPAHTSENQRTKSISVVMERGDLLKPIDMEIHFITIHSSLEKLKNIVMENKSTETGIELIKSFKKISEISVTIQKISKFTFNREKPIVSPEDDKITKVQKTLIYTYENNVDLLADAKRLYESSENNVDLAKELEEAVSTMDKVLVEELSSLQQRFNPSS